MTQLTYVPTPIGNLKDITVRALEVLRIADVVAAEDTRRTRKLMSHYEISTPENEEPKTRIERFMSGEVGLMEYPTAELTDWMEI